MAKVGRRTKFTDETRQKIYAALLEGLPYEHVAAKAGISSSILFKWLAAARELENEIEETDKDEADLSPEDLELLQFLRDFRNTEASLLSEVLSEVKRDDRKWYLTRRFRSEYEEIQKIDVSANVQHELSWVDIVKGAESEN